MIHLKDEMIILLGLLRIVRFTSVELYIYDENCRKCWCFRQIKSIRKLGGLTREC